LVAAALNLAVATLAWLAGARARGRAAGDADAERALAGHAPADAAPPVSPAALLDPASRRAVAVLFALSGFGALAFQLAWVRLFGLVFGSSVYSFSAVLGVYLLGIALGSALVSPRLPRVATLAGFGALQLLLAASAAVALQAFPGLPQRML